MDFSKGMAWGTILSLPLWISFFGWIKIVSRMASSPLIHNVHHILHQLD